MWKTEKSVGDASFPKRKRLQTRGTTHTWIELTLARHIFRLKKNRPHKLYQAVGGHGRSFLGGQPGGPGDCRRASEPAARRETSQRLSHSRWWCQDQASNKACRRVIKPCVKVQHEGLLSNDKTNELFTGTTLRAHRALARCADSAPTSRAKMGPTRTDTLSHRASASRALVRVTMDPAFLPQKSA